MPASAPPQPAPPAAAAKAATVSVPIPSLPYTLPADISQKGQTLYEKIKPILDAKPEQIATSIGETQFCVATEGATKRINTAIVYVFSEFLQEALKANPDTCGEAFKRMIALKHFLKHGDHFLFLSARPRCFLALTRQRHDDLTSIQDGGNSCDTYLTVCCLQWRVNPHA